MDDLRLLLMREPRGHGAMSGAILQPPTRADADWGVLFIEVSGCLPMCGHGTIGVATVLVETGMVAVTEPETVVRLDVPAGLVEARVAVEDGRARARDAAQRARRSCTPATARWRPTGSATVATTWRSAATSTRSSTRPRSGVEVDPARAGELVERGAAVMTAINAADRPVHPDDDRIAGCHHVVFHAPGRDGADARAAMAIHPGWLDRSPCGTGTSARMAQLHARGELRDRRAVRQRVGHRHAVHRPARGGDGGRRAAGGRPRDHRPRLDHRDGPVPARRRGPVPGRLRAVSADAAARTSSSSAPGSSARRARASWRCAASAVTLVDRGEVASGTTGLGEGNVLASDKDAGPELELTPRGPRDVRRDRGAARARRAHPAQGRADRPHRTSRRGRRARARRAPARGTGCGAG